MCEIVQNFSIRKNKSKNGLFNAKKISVLHWENIFDIEICRHFLFCSLSRYELYFFKKNHNFVSYQNCIKKCNFIYGSPGCLWVKKKLQYILQHVHFHEEAVVFFYKQATTFSRSGNSIENDKSRCNTLTKLCLNTLTY